jgi:hypothetical protein
MFLVPAVRRLDRHAEVAMGGSTAEAERAVASTLEP